MSKYYQVNVELRSEDEKGKVKKIREQYLVDGVSCLDAETTVNKMFVDEGNTLDYTIKSVKETKFYKVL